MFGAISDFPSWLQLLVRIGHILRRCVENKPALRSRSTKHGGLHLSAVVGQFLRNLRRHGLLKTWIRPDLFQFQWLSALHKAAVVCRIQTKLLNGMRRLVVSQNLFHEVIRINATLVDVSRINSFDKRKGLALTQGIL